MAKKERIEEATRTLPNGRKEVPSMLLTPITVDKEDKDNLVSTVIADGFHKMADVYRDIPRDQWPAAK